LNQPHTTDTTSSSPELSVLIPVYQEAENLEPLCQRLIPILTQVSTSWEIVFVNDGSRDDTLARLRALNASEPRIKAVSLSRNFGKEIAIAAGLDHTFGHAVILMDADLQHPPEVIPTFVEKWREGFAMVYGQRTDRVGESAFKRGFARIFYRLFASFGETPLPRGAGDFRLIDRKGVDALRAMGERARFSKGLYSWIGFSSIGVPYTVEKRLHGTTKWSFRKLFRFAFDGITSFSTMPLRLSIYVGALISTFAMGTGLYYFIRTLFYGTDVPGYPSLIVSILFLSGIQLIFLGVIGEYVGRIFAEVKRRPLYLVGERVGATVPIQLQAMREERR
jgi:polyisoprenyl-phosphate glycosyltransferase